MRERPLWSLAAAGLVGLVSVALAVLWIVRGPVQAAVEAEARALLGPDLRYQSLALDWFGPSVILSDVTHPAGPAVLRAERLILLLEHRSVLAGRIEPRRLVAPGVRLDLASWHLEGGEVSARWVGNTWRFRGEIAGNIQIAGTWSGPTRKDQPGQVFSLEAVLRDVELTPLAAALESVVILTGLADGTVRVSGTTHSPTSLVAALALREANLQFADFSIRGPIDLQLELVANPGQEGAAGRFVVEATGATLEYAAFAYRKEPGTLARVSGELTLDAHGSATIGTAKLDLRDLDARIQ